MLRQNPRPFVYAVLVHLVLLGVLVFSLDWTSTVKPTASRQHAPIQAVAVDAKQLDSELQRKRALEEQKQREAEEQRKREEAAKLAELKKVEQEKQRQAELKRKAEEEVKRNAEAERKRQADLAAKKQAEAEKKRQEEEARKQAEAEKQRQEEEARKRAEAEKQRQEEEARKRAEAERRQREEEAKRKAEQELQARLAAEEAREAAQRRSAMQSMIGEYVLYIQQKVERSWIRPPSGGSQLSCMVEVRLIPSGEVIDAQIVRSSGNSAFDRSVEAAVFKASPLPVPPDPDVMEQFRSLRFEFRPGSA